MTRIIKASEVQPGMELQWTYAGITRQCTPSYVETVSPRGGAYLRTFEGGSAQIPSGAEVTVLSEPQPEEPVTLCARIVVAGRKIYRWTEDPKEPWPWRGEALNVDPVLWSWGQLCGLGPVTVVDADPSWTVPDDTEPTPEVPDRIEEWPEDDTALRPYPWRDRDGDIWSWAEAKAKWKCHDHMGVYRTADHWPSSLYAPFTRDSDA